MSSFTNSDCNQIGEGFIDILSIAIPIYLGHRASASLIISRFKQLDSACNFFGGFNSHVGDRNLFPVIAVSSRAIPRIPNKSPLFVSPLFSISITVSLRL